MIKYLVKKVEIPQIEGNTKLEDVYYNIERYLYNLDDIDLTGCFEYDKYNKARNKYDSIFIDDTMLSRLNGLFLECVFIAELDTEDPEGFEIKDFRCNKLIIEW